MVLCPLFHGWDKQRLMCTGPPILERHQAGVKLTIHKGICEILPVGRLDDVALIFEVRDKSCLPLQIQRRARRLGGLADLAQQDVAIDD